MFNWLKLILGDCFRCNSCRDVKNNYEIGMHLSDEKGYRVFCKECAKTNQDVIRSFKRILDE
jgi:nitrate/TMAO reductase-like tetraheme cytochrome c subunit